MADQHRILIHAQAPRKPAQGLACNGCGICCADLLCPLAILRFRRRQGPCPALRWQNADSRYVCGLLVDARGWRAALIRRWIGAGCGCDSSAQLGD